MLMFVVFVLAVTLLIISKIQLLIHTDCKSKVCLAGKTALVTGGNSGIGYNIVLGLLQRGCKVIIADKVKDPNLLENIYKETRSRNVVFQYVDLSSFKSTRELAKNVKESEERLDILVHNAGVGRDTLDVTEDGLDVVLQINYFSAFLLTHLLVDLVKKSKGRILFTSSGLAFVHKFFVEKLRPEGIKSSSYLYHYQNSKLCLIVAADMFAEKLKKYGVTSNTYHPGIVVTNIFPRSMHTNGKYNSTKLMIRMLQFSAWFGGKSPEQAAQTAIYLACANEVDNVTGEFFFECKPAMKPGLTQRRKDCQAIWDVTEEIVKLGPEERFTEEIQRPLHIHQFYNKFDSQSLVKEIETNYRVHQRSVPLSEFQILPLNSRRPICGKIENVWNNK